MAFRSRSRGRIRLPRKRAIWVNIPFGAVAYTETFGMQTLLTAEDWEAQFTSLANERAVLRAIVGEIFIFQNAVSTTPGNATFWGLFMTDANVTATPAFTTTGMSEFDWLRTGVMPNTTTVTASTIQASRANVIPINIKAKRRMTSQDEIRLGLQCASDAGTPGGTCAGLLRFLVARD